MVLTFWSDLKIKISPGCLLIQMEISFFFFWETVKNRVLWSHVETFSFISCVSALNMTVFVLCGALTPQRQTPDPVFEELKQYLYKTTLICRDFATCKDIHQVYYTLRLWGLEAEWKGRQRKEGERSNKTKERRHNDKIYKVNNPSDDNWTHPVKYCSKNLLKYLAEWARKKKSSKNKRHWKWDCREGPEPWSQLWAQWCLLSPEGGDLLIDLTISAS